MGLARPTGNLQGDAANDAQKGNYVRVTVGQGEQVEAVGAKEAYPMGAPRGDQLSTNDPSPTYFPSHPPVTTSRPEGEKQTSATPSLLMRRRTTVGQPVRTQCRTRTRSWPGPPSTNESRP